MIGILTGVQKSGNSWIGAMVRALAFGAPDQNTIERSIRTHPVNAAAIAFNRAAPQRITAQQLLHWLIGRAEPGDSHNALRIDGRGEMRAALLPVARSIRTVWARASIDPGLTTSEIQLRLLDRLGKPVDSANSAPGPWVGMSKHTPVQNVLSAYPRSKVVWIVRDPRDCLVSFFFHDLATLKSTKLAWLFDSDDQLRESRGAIRALLSARVSIISRFLELSSEIDARQPGDRVLIVNYEEMLREPVTQLTRVADFLDLTATADQVDRVAAQFDRTRMQGGKVADASSQRDSFVRAARSGDWRHYFEAGHRDLIDDRFRDGLVRLGYEPDNRWLDALPVEAESQFQLSRFRPRSSAVYAFEELWLKDDELQKRFPLPHSHFAEGSYFEWLAASDRPETKEWFAATHVIKEKFGFVANEQRSLAENLLGF